MPNNDNIFMCLYKSQLEHFLPKKIIALPFFVLKLFLGWMTLFKCKIEPFKGPQP